ncbi:MAG: ribulose-phosphate 3-epimerase [Anaerolineales bacterium]
MNEIYLAASILSADFTCLREQIQSAENAGSDWIHIDVMDGHFVPNITMGPIIVEACRRLTTLPLDVHLMIEQPERHIESFANAGADLISIHVEGNPNIHRTLQQIRALGCKPGVVLNPGTPAISITPLIRQIDYVLVMTVNPGFAAQKYITEVTPKIVEIKEFLDHYHSHALIEVDGGINAETISLVVNAGARVIVAGSSIFSHPKGIAEGIKALRQAIH